MSDEEYLDVIREFVREGLDALDPPSRAWAEARVVDPRPWPVFINGEPARTETFYLVTDNVGHEDYRVVYDPALITFGLIQESKDGRDVLIGLYGTFADAVRGM